MNHSGSQTFTANALRLVAITALSLLASLAAPGCLSPGSTRVEPRTELSELDVVDCIVEGSVRQMGRSFAYQEPPRMARVTERECASLGGSFVLYDPADPSAVIAKWLPFAEDGDARAQHRLGLIYEGVLGAEPDYEKAATWYGRAADAGHRESMYALSVLYEKGLGVERDVLKALDLYRRASGIEGDSLMLSSQAAHEIEAVRTALSREVRDLRAQRETLAAQVKRLEGEQKREEARQLAALGAGVQEQLTRKQQTLASLPAYRLLDPGAAGGDARFSFPVIPGKVLRSQKVGKFYALVIGNNQYEHMPALRTPHNDARRISALLSERYGFSTRLLLDANEEQIKRAIHALSEQAGPADNLLIYFAGHGHMDRVSERSRLHGYWLPTNADRDQDVNWVDNWWITDHLDASSARRALVIADSCYGGVFSTDLPIGPVTSLPPLATAELAKKLERRSRFVLASGGVSPAVDATTPTAEHSIFASAFIDVLETNSGAISVVELYGRVFDRMFATLENAGIRQEPELRVIRAAGHQSEGDFYFVRN